MLNAKVVSVVEDAEQEARDAPWAGIIHAMIVDSERERTEERSRRQSRRHRQPTRR